MAGRGGKLRVTLHPCCKSSEPDVPHEGISFGAGDLRGIPSRARSKDELALGRLFKKWAQSRSFEVEAQKDFAERTRTDTAPERILQVGPPEESLGVPPGEVWRIELPVPGVGPLWFWFGVPKSGEKVILLCIHPRTRRNANGPTPTERARACRRWGEIAPRGTIDG